MQANFYLTMHIHISFFSIFIPLTSGFPIQILVYINVTIISLLYTNSDFCSSFSSSVQAHTSIIFRNCSGISFFSNNFFSSLGTIFSFPSSHSLSLVHLVLTLQHFMGILLLLLLLSFHQLILLLLLLLLFTSPLTAHQSVYDYVFVHLSMTHFLFCFFLYWKHINIVYTKSA